MFINHRPLPRTVRAGSKNHLMLSFTAFSRQTCSCHPQVGSPGCYPAPLRSAPEKSLSVACEISKALLGLEKATNTRLAPGMIPAGQLAAEHMQREEAAASLFCWAGWQLDVGHVEPNQGSQMQQTLATRGLSYGAAAQPVMLSW